MTFLLENNSQNVLCRRRTHESSVRVPNLELAFVELVSEESAIQYACEYAIKRWKEAFDRRAFFEKIRLYENYVIHGESEEERQAALDDLFLYFKKVRKSALYLRTAFELFDQTHQCPEDLSEFSWSLGQFKDAFHLPEPGIKSAKSLLDFLNSSSRQLELIEIKQSDLNSVLKHAQNSISTVTHLFENTELPAKKFHKLRKKLRLFSILFTIAVNCPAYTRFSVVKEYMVTLNDELGEINDAMTVKSLSGGPDYDQQVVTLASDLRQKIRNLL